MARYIFDIETNGLLDVLTRIHCLVLVDIDTHKVHDFADQLGYRPIYEGLRMLEDAELIAGHNVINFDVPAIQKVVPGWRPKGAVRDTMTMARVVWPKDHLKGKDFALHKVGRIPGQLIGRYSLEAFGYRLMDYKGDYDGGWDEWSPEMHEYMLQDGHVTLRLWNRLAKEEWPEDSYELEHLVAEIVSRQERRGFTFDEAGAATLYATIVQRRVEVEAALAEAFPPLTIRTPFTPKSTNKKLGYVKGVPTEKVRIEEFNPASRDHIAKRLKMMGWEPDEFTDGGKPKVDEKALSGLTTPEAKLLSEYLMLDKRLGQIATGKEAWLKAVGKDGRIHGRVETNGAVTGRMTHSKPNMAQVPASRSPYGHECRALFLAGTYLDEHGHTRRYALVGADADALELRCLAHFMARYDDGEYVRTVLEGRKEDGTDIHSVNARALGLDPKTKYHVGGKDQSGRDIAKTWFYAFIYGAGDEKLGTILGKAGSEARKAGKRSRARFLANLPALGKLVEAVKAAAKKGWLKGLDGRKLYVRSDHAALNTLLQSAGALVMKQALIILDTDLQAEGFIPGVDYEFVANVHDEWQIEARPEIAQLVGQIAKAAIRKAGEHFAFRCPLDGAFEVGASWADTH